MTLLNYTDSINPKDNVVIIATSKTDFTKHGLTPAEVSYIAKQIEKEEHIININQYSRRVTIYIGEGKKEEYLTLEAYRKAGNRICGIMNAAKVASVTIDDTLGNKANTLAFAEGMALGNYQFIHHRKDAKKVANSLKTINIHSKKVKADDIETLQIVLDATCKARDHG